MDHTGRHPPTNENSNTDDVTDDVITDRFSREVKAIDSVRPSVRLFSPCLLNRLTLELQFVRELAIEDGFSSFKTYVYRRINVHCDFQIYEHVGLSKVKF